MAQASKTPSRSIVRFRVHNWMNFRSADVRITSRLFVVGPNASGKSNLLDALRFLRDIVSIGGGLQEAVRKRGGLSSIRCLAARQSPNVEVLIEIESDTSPGNAWSYELSLKQDNQRRPLIAKETVKRGNRTLLSRPDDDDVEDEDRLLQTHLQQVNANRDFREVSDFLKSVEYLHLVPQLVREPDRLVARDNDPFGSGLLETMAQTPKMTLDAWLRRIQKALKNAVPQLSELKLERDSRGVPHLKGRYEHWRPNAGWQNETQFSDGTLRLIGLLWSTLSRGGPLLLEEPELSLHPEIVRVLPGLLSSMQDRTGRQVLISTHSPELLADEGIGMDEVLLLLPSSEGTAARLASDDQEAKDLLDGGLTLPEVVIPRTAPRMDGQLHMFEP